jgi:hypothetical protein
LLLHPEAQICPLVHVRHGLQPACPVSPWYWPASQDVQSPVAPTVFWYLPASQPAHWAIPVPVWYLPTAHWLQRAATVPGWE